MQKHASSEMLARIALQAPRAARVGDREAFREFIASHGDHEMFDGEIKTCCFLNGKR